MSQLKFATQIIQPERCLSGVYVLLGQNHSQNIENKFNNFFFYLSWLPFNQALFEFFHVKTNLR